jgi:hypothetical protein
VNLRKLSNLLNCAHLSLEDRNQGDLTEFLQIFFASFVQFEEQLLVDLKVRNRIFNDYLESLRSSAISFRSSRKAELLCASPGSKLQREKSFLWLRFICQNIQKLSSDLFQANASTISADTFLMMDAFLNEAREDKGYYCSGLSEIRSGDLRKDLYSLFGPIRNMPPTEKRNVMKDGISMMNEFDKFLDGCVRIQPNLTCFAAVEESIRCSIASLLSRYRTVYQKYMSSLF